MFIGIHKVYESEEEGELRTFFEVTVYAPVNSKGTTDDDIYEDGLYPKFSFLKEFSIYSEQEAIDVNARMIEYYIIFDITGYEEVREVKPHLFI